MKWEEMMTYFSPQHLRVKMRRSQNVYEGQSKSSSTEVGLK